MVSVYVPDVVRETPLTDDGNPPINGTHVPAEITRVYVNWYCVDPVILPITCHILFPVPSQCAALPLTDHED
jgi:hypothetical protein